MTESEAQLERALFDAGALNLADFGADRLSCPTCCADLTRVPLAARFCPRCGGEIPRDECAEFVAVPVPMAKLAPVRPPPPLAASDAPSPAVPPLRPPYVMIPIAPFVPPAPRVPGTFTYPVVAGYANAMFRLGRRYEFGQGADRNVNEAFRCYAKAARLGNPSAWSRLVRDVPPTPAAPAPAAQSA